MAGAQARRLGTLVEDMLVLARADAGGYPLRPVDLYLDDVVDECRRAVDVLAAERGITVTSARRRPSPLRGDEELLRRLMVNLLQNAVQHTPKAAPSAVDISPNGSRVYVRVTTRARVSRQPISHASSIASCSSIRRAGPKGRGWD